ncbi:HEAT repeat domain-containing protein [Streptomyces sp. NPDC001982]|uniref:HEAT repeat domain-containing protein n=1 Tax=Streptomyces sp. NPDC001982 TaxID=3154405 RepID=UPI00331B2AB4
MPRRLHPPTPRTQLTGHLTTHRRERRALFRLTHDDDGRTRIAAAEKLSDMTMDDFEVRDALIRLAFDEDVTVRITAAQQLVLDWPGEPEVRDVLVRLTDDSDPQVALAAQGWLKDRGWPL